MPSLNFGGWSNLNERQEVGSDSDTSICWIWKWTVPLELCVSHYRMVIQSVISLSCRFCSWRRLKVFKPRVFLVTRNHDATSNEVACNKRLHRSWASLLTTCTHLSISVLFHSSTRADEHLWNSESNTHKVDMALTARTNIQPMPRRTRWKWFLQNCCGDAWLCKNSS